MADASAPRKRVRPRKFVGSTKAPSSSSSAVPLNSIPQSLLENEALNAAISALPSNYSFEIHKTLAHIQRHGSTMVALQLPEGLQMYACAIADIIERFSDALTVVLADVTYGACCVDDYTAKALGCDLLVHYGHSCLVPVDVTTGIRTLYIFVEIAIDEKHLVETVRLNLPDTKSRFLESLGEEKAAGEAITNGLKQHLAITHDGEEKELKEEESAAGAPTSLALVSTIQFVSALSRLKESLSSPLLNSSSPNLWPGAYVATVPRSHPLSPGEILGCTAPRLPDAPDAFIYLGDGRFHLEAAMIANPGVPAFRYDPYSKKLTREGYDHARMRDTRSKAVKTAEGKGTWGIILGTLGRQGNPGHLKAISSLASSGSQTSITPIPILLSELSPAKLALFNDSIDVFVQTSCPRLSIDWGAAFAKPLLSVYESGVALGKWGGWWEDGEYPMDFYARGSRWVEARKMGEFITT